MRRPLSFAMASAVLLSAPSALPAQARTAPAPAAAPARTLPAGSYEFTSTDDDGDVSTGTVRWIGQQMRIDMHSSESSNRARRNGGNITVQSTMKKRDYILVDFATNTVRTVKPDEREISELPLATFEQIIGKALGMVGSVVQMQVRDAGIVANELGAGGQVAGLPVKQYRMIEEYNVRIGVFGMSAEEKHHRVVTEYWVPTGPGVPRNPVVELMMRGASALAQQDATHQRNVSRARNALFTGVPVKATVTVTEAGESPKRSSVELTSLSTTSPDAALFVLPTGYKVKKDNFNISL